MHADDCSSRARAACFKTEAERRRREDSAAGSDGWEGTPEGVVAVVWLTCSDRGEGPAHGNRQGYSPLPPVSFSGTGQHSFRKCCS